MPTAHEILLIEDSESDAVLLQRALEVEILLVAHGPLTKNENNGCVILGEVTASPTPG